jgi:hypothetical protein
MITYKLLIPIFIVGGLPRNLTTSYHKTLDEVRSTIKDVEREYGRYARVFRITEEEIDITKEEW